MYPHGSPILWYIWISFAACVLKKLILILRALKPYATGIWNVVISGRVHFLFLYLTEFGHKAL